MKKQGFSKENSRCRLVLAGRNERSKIIYVLQDNGGIRVELSGDHLARFIHFGKKISVLPHSIGRFRLALTFPGLVTKWGIGNALALAEMEEKQ